jgi:hypothetical protein
MAVRLAPLSLTLPESDMIALILLLIRLMITCLVLVARLTFWMLKAIVVIVTTAAVSISAGSATPQRRSVSRM